MTDSDVRCRLLLAAMRASREAEQEHDAARAGRVMADHAEPVVLSEPGRGG
jgi:hypothetical protein